MGQLHARRGQTCVDGIRRLVHSTTSSYLGRTRGTHSEIYEVGSVSLQLRGDGDVVSEASGALSLYMFYPFAMATPKIDKREISPAPKREA